MQTNVYMRFFREIAILESLTKARMEKALPREMKISHFSVLNSLSHEDNRTPAEIAKAFMVTRPSMTNTLQKLETQNYVAIVEDSTDGRSKRVRLTKQGKRALGEAIKALSAVFQDVSEKLGETPFEDALPSVERIRHYMDSNRSD